MTFDAEQTLRAKERLVEDIMWIERVERVLAWFCVLAMWVAGAVVLWVVR